MLTNIHLKNFKLHENTSIEAAPLTVFVGPNNSGKSSIFQALLALKQAAARRSESFLGTAQRQATSAEQPFLFEAASMIDLGEFGDVVRPGQHELLLGIKGEFGPLFQSPKFTVPKVEFEVAVLENKLARHEGEIYISGVGPFTWKYITASPGTYPQPYAKVENYQLKFTPLANFGLLQPDHPQPAAGWRPGMADQLIEIGSATAQAPGYLLATLHFIAPLRGFEECGHPLAKEASQSLQQRMSLSDRAVALATTIASNVRLKREISNRLIELLGIGVDVEFVGSSSVKIFATDEKRGDGQRSFVNEGTGAGQLPFLLVPIALTPKNETVLLAEPEAHLHPKAQYDLARMLLTISKRENIQFIIETHSEHVLHVILNAVAKGELTPDEVALIYFQNKNGVAEVNRRAVTRLGQVEGGLPDFFEHNMVS